MMNFWINSCTSRLIFQNFFIRNILIVLTFSAYQNGFSQIATQLSDLSEIVLTEKSISFWQDTKSENLDVKNAANQSFNLLPNLYPNFGFVRHDVWFRCILKNTTSKEIETNFRLSNPNLDQIDIYKQASQEFVLLANTGDIRPYSNRKLKNRTFIVPFKIPEGRQDTFLLRVNNGGEQFQFILSVVSEKYFQEKDSNTHLYLGIYFGIIGFIIIFNIFSYLALGDKTALWYAGYVLFFGLLQLSLTGYGTEKMWSSAYWVNRANPFFASASILFLLYFSTGYLKTKEIMPKMHKIFNFFRVSVLICLVFSLIPMDFFYYISLIAINVITLLLNLLIIPVAIYAVKLKVQEATLFLLAFTVLIIAVFGFILKNFGIIPSSFLSEFGLQIGSSIESILLSIGIVLKFKTTRENAIDILQNLNTLKEQTNLELELKVKERTQEVENQKVMLELKNEEVLSSIASAKRIQESLLPSLEQIKFLLPNTNVWLAPKDIVAGDFYWIHQRQFNGKNWIFFAVGDCTGHGVPGAMLSVLCMNALESSVKDLNQPNPGILLEKASIYLNINFTNDKQQLNDEMDISLACFEPESRMLHWAGANNPLWIQRENTIIQFPPTKRPVGKTTIVTPFFNNEIQLQLLDRLFLFTDGYVDQFGGSRNKKFKRINFLKVLELHSQALLDDQMSAIKFAFHDWKGEEDQVDDICILQMEVL